MNRNNSLNSAGLARKDEFFTPYEVIENEMKFHSSQFADKTVICNCDNLYESEFVKYFIENFNELQLKKLLAVEYAHSDSIKKGDDVESHSGLGRSLEVIYVNSNDKLSLDDVLSDPRNSIKILADDGDFRKNCSLNLLLQADIVVTNPPFSLLKEFIPMLFKYNKQFLIIGSQNSITYKEVFPFVKKNQLWFGETIHSGSCRFFVPDAYPLETTNSGYDSLNRKYISVSGVRWITNLDVPRRHLLMNLEQKFQIDAYKKYENYSAIDVSRTRLIPSDYEGIMGVPITFLDYYCPEQFEILLLANGNVRACATLEEQEAVGYCAHPEDRGGVGIIDGKRKFPRLLIRKK